MANLDSALAACKDATNQLITAAERTGNRWTTPPAPGKWSPSQIVEHVARVLEESANVAAGRPSSGPKLPALLHPILRTFVFKRVLKQGFFPKARTSKSLNPASGPATLAEGRTRLESAHTQFDLACRALAARETILRTTVFGAVPLADYVRFMELHTRHHEKQISQV